MRTIHKWALDPDWTSVSTFECARVLHVETQNGVPCIWAEVNTLERECIRHFVTVPTGCEVPADVKYVGSAVGVEGWLVFHVYEPLG